MFVLTRDLYRFCLAVRVSNIKSNIKSSNNFLLTEREGRTGEYWPEVVAAARSVQKRPRANIPQYGSS